MDEIEWTNLSVEDLSEIHDFIAKDNPAAAARMLDRIGAAISRLRDFPLSGRVVRQSRPREVREILVGKYRVPYEIAEKGVRILRVVHGARLIHPGGLEQSDD